MMESACFLLRKYTWVSDHEEKTSFIYVQVAFINFLHQPGEKHFFQMGLVKQTVAFLSLSHFVVGQGTLTSKKADLDGTQKELDAALS